MGYPRKYVINEDKVETVHCFSRCVRKAFLCGVDRETGRNYEHRREWIASRLSVLSEHFAVEVIAFAVMENHHHSMLRTRPDLAASWTPIEVALRWRAVYPKRFNRDGSPVDPDKEAAELASDPARIAVLRKRLSSVSWFNRALNEHIARKANREDGCTGCFWEGRFKCKKALTDSAAIVCSAYVDLNPVRARDADVPEEASYCSFSQRVKGDDAQTDVSLLPIADAFHGRITEIEYFQLVDETGRIQIEGKGAISSFIPPILERLGISTDGWLSLMPVFISEFKGVVADSSSIDAYAADMGKRWFQGKGAASKLFIG